MCEIVAENMNRFSVKGKDSNSSFTIFFFKYVAKTILNVITTHFDTFLRLAPC